MRTISRSFRVGLRRVSRRSLAAFAGSAVVIATASSSASAEELRVTSQAAAANAAWLAYAPPPAQGSLKLCLVDSGVTLNADLTAAVTMRTAVDGEGGDDVDPSQHGTKMAMIAGAARNGVGMIGAFPGIDIVSVRAGRAPAAGTRMSFSVPDYSRAIRRCQADPDIAAIELALGGSRAPTAEEIATFNDHVTKSHSRGASVIAAAGNDGGPVNLPGMLPGVFAVGASTPSGGLCDFSSRGAGLDLVAPGCELDTADAVSLERRVGAGGTSQASAFAAAIVVALRSYRRDLSWEQSEQLLQTTARDGVLDAAAAFRAAGLDAVVDAGVAATPKPPADPPREVPQQEAPAPLPPSVPAAAPERAVAPVGDALRPFARPRTRAATCRRGG